MSRLRSDISSMQDDLKLTRKTRKEGEDDDFLSYLESLKQKAKVFYKQKMLYIFCPKCRRLLSTTWLLYPDNEKNFLHLKCDNKNCNYEFDVILADLYKTGNRNIDDVAIG